MTADLNSLWWKIYEKTLCQPWQIEEVLKITREHLSGLGYTSAAVSIAPTPVQSPIVCEVVPRPATGNPDEFFNKELAVYADNVDAEHS